MRGGRNCAAMVRARNFPENRECGESMNSPRVPHRNVTVDCAMNEQNWDVSLLHRVFRRNPCHVKSVFPARAKKGDLDQWAQHGSSHPRAKSKRLSHAVVSDLAKIGKWRLRDYGTKLRTCGERLQKLRGPHRFSQTVDTSRSGLVSQQSYPVANVVAL